MNEVPKRLVSAIREAGISVDPSHPEFRRLAQDIWELIEREAREVREVIGGDEERTIFQLISEVRNVSIGPLLRLAKADRAHTSILIFSSAVRSRASEIVAARNRRTGGYAEAPPSRVHDHRPIKPTWGRKWRPN